MVIHHLHMKIQKNKQELKWFTVVKKSYLVISGNYVRVTFVIIVKHIEQSDKVLSATEGWSRTALYSLNS